MSAVIDAIFGRAQSDGERTAIADGNRRLSYSQLETAVTELAAALKVQCTGAQPIASLLDNSLAWIILDLALVYLGRTHIPLPLFFMDEQRQHALASAGAGHLIVAAAPSTAIVNCAGVALAVVALPFTAKPLPSGTAKITFTSGSTGAPKGVCLSQDTLEETASSICQVVGAEHADSHLAILPLSVLLENVAGLYAVLMAGGTYVCPDLASLGFSKPFAPDFMQMVSALNHHKASSAIMVPELLRGLVMTLRATRQELSHMRFLAVGGASVSPLLLAEAAEVGLPVYEGYGLSEAGSVITLNRPGQARPGTAGPFLPHVSASIATDGELVIIHPVFLGYVGASNAPATLATGDKVKIDETGAISILGRKSNLIITSFGRNVSPEWVERELLAQPAIRQAFVYGDGKATISALIVPMHDAIDNTVLDAAVASANVGLPAYAAVGQWRRASPFAPQNGQLTANGRLRRSAIHDAYGLSKISYQELTA